MSKLSNLIKSIWRGLEHREITHQEANNGFRNGELSEKTMDKMLHNRGSLAFIVIIVFVILFLLIS